MLTIECPKCGRYISLTKRSKLVNHNTNDWRTQTGSRCPASGTHPNEWITFGFQAKIGTHALSRVIMKPAGDVILGSKRPNLNDRIMVQSITEFDFQRPTWLECLVDEIRGSIYFLSLA